MIYHWKDDVLFTATSWVQSAKSKISDWFLIFIISLHEKLMTCLNVQTKIDIYHWPSSEKSKPSSNTWWQPNKVITSGFLFCDRTLNSFSSTFKTMEFWHDIAKIWLGWTFSMKGTRWKSPPRILEFPCLLLNPRMNFKSWMTEQ